MVVITAVGGFLLWFFVRQFLSSKDDALAALLCIGCFVAAFALDVYVNQDVVHVVVLRVRDLWSRPVIF